jgi:hypothetical protein
MIDISMGGLLGAIAGTVVAALIYGTLASLVERLIAARRVQEPQEPAISRDELAMLRRGVLTVELLICAGLGYWLGDKIAG